MYDDVANDISNPHKGKLFNRPGGPDVYAGMPRDYTGNAVNADVFLQVLLGGKVTPAYPPCCEHHRLSMPVLCILNDFAIPRGT